MKKKIIVTGGAGYIGSHTCVELIASNYEPIIIDNFYNSKHFIIDRIEEITGFRPDILDTNCLNYEQLRLKISSYNNINGIIHFAAYKAVGESTQKPLKYYQNNIGSTINMLKILEDFKFSSFIFSSSSTVYGQPKQLPVTEESPILLAESPYGRTKQICEDVISDYSKANSTLKAVSLRYFNPIGAHPSSLIGELPLGAPNNLVPFITQTAAGIRKELSIFGHDYSTSDGTCIRDYIHVVDLARAHVAALKFSEAKKNGLFEIFNLGSGQGNSVLEVVQAFEEICEEKLNYKFSPRRPGDVVEVYANVEKAKNEMGWETKLSLKDALKDAWNWELALRKTLITNE